MHGQAATSATTAALASSLAQKTAYKVLVTHNHIERSALEGYLLRQPTDVEKSVHNITNQGLDALVRLYKNGRLKPDMVADYTHSLLKDHRLDILAGTAKREKTTAGELDVLINIIKCAREFYDLVLMDTHSGLNENNSLKILESSDIIVFCINQNLFLLEDLKKFQSKYPFLKQKRSVYVISRYEKSGLISRGYIARKYGLNKASMFEFPNSTNFMEALNTGRVFEYIAFYKNAKACTDKTLIESLDRLCNFIIEGSGRIA